MFFEVLFVYLRALKGYKLFRNPSEKPYKHISTHFMDKQSSIHHRTVHNIMLASSILLMTCWTHNNATTLTQTTWKPREWPILKHYDVNHLKEVALPLGGIGTGTVSLGGRGELRDWEIMNTPARKFSTVTDGNDAPFFSIYVKSANESPTCKLLAGPMYTDEYLHYEGRPINHYGMPRFAEASFDAVYPFGQVNLSDPNVPVKVRIKGFNPLIPADEESSGLPVAILSYEVTNTSDKPLEAAVCGNIRNFIGKDGSQGRTDWKGDFIPEGARHNKNHFVADAEMGLHGIVFTSDGVDTLSTAWGNMCLATDAQACITYRTFSADNDWNVSILDFWDDFSADGMVKNPTPSIRKSIGRDQDPMASLCVKQTLAPGETKTYNFYLTWNFPNRKAWSKTIVGNWYSTQHSDAWQTACMVAQNVAHYEQQTLLFVNALLDSSFPEEMKEAALFNLNVLRSQTVFRIKSGHMLGWEGVMDRFGSCQGSCTHVWNYEVATPFLFGHLARTMREVETEYALHDDGAMAFRVSLPLANPDPNRNVAADGQMGCVMKLYREWQLSGDNRFLQDHWQACKKMLSYAWTERGWDGNCDGVMEGSQHNTMDVNYFGPNPQMGFWYMGALRAAEEMAKAMRDKVFAQKCRQLFTMGSQWMDEHLFNGEYYEQRITDPKTFDFLEPDSPDIPPYQLGKGCLVDQLVGQYMAHICGLGYLGNPTHIRTTLENIMRYNYLPDFSQHFNNMRSYVIGNEAGLLMASWPKGRLEVPFPYFSESMTGFEYTAATGMIYEGLEADGLKCIKAIRDRFDGAKRNPFSEPECGHHYARSMASWATLLAYSGFHYSAIDKSMTFADRTGTWFWSNGYAWGTASINKQDVKVTVLKGSLSLRELMIGKCKSRKKIELKAGESIKIKMKQE